MSDQSANRDLSGGCICGGVTYTARGRPDRAYACHCSDCQKRSGSAFAMMLPVPLSKFKVEGETTSIEQEEANGIVAQLHVCSNCLTRIYTLNPIWTDLVILRVGTLADTSHVMPAFHIWTESRQPWFDLPAHVPHFETQPASPDEWRALLA